MGKALISTRRIFATAALGLLLSGCVSDIVGLVDDMKVNVRLGVMAHTEISGPKDVKALERALDFYRQSKVDAIVIAGKAVKGDEESGLKAIAESVARVFGDQPVQVIVGTGKHEVKGFAFAVADGRPASRCEQLTFYGDAKRALTDELCFYPRKNNAISAGSMSGLDVNGAYFDADEIRRKCGRVAQGLLVSVYDDVTRIRRLDFTAKYVEERGKYRVTVPAGDVADPWVIGEPVVDEQAPQFWADTSIRVVSGNGKGGEPIYTLKWPNVQRRFTGARALSYEVSVSFANEAKSVFMRRTVLSRNFYLGEELDAEGTQCVFKASELPKKGETAREIVFAVTPIGVLGKRGKTFSTIPVPLR